MTNIKIFIIHLYRRLFHLGLKLFALLYPLPKPKLVSGQSEFVDWLTTVKPKHSNPLLVVSDATLDKLGMIDIVTEQLSKTDIEYIVYTNVDPNPSFDNVELGVEMYQQNKCSGIIAIGGGSVMDCAKLIGARITRPNKSLRQMKGLFKVLKKLPPLYAVPTTAGTGSETTVVAVVSDHAEKKKYAITDPVLTPTVAILLPELTHKLPPHITSTTGMDALTHAIESYIGMNHSAFSRPRSLKAIKLIFTHLVPVTKDGNDLVARENMLLASFYAGEAFTRTSVGYVHAIAHQLGGLYGTPHGLANAVILPKVLRWYGDSIHQKLAQIADYCELSGPSTSIKEKAELVLQKIEQMNQLMDIPSTISTLKAGDVDLIVQQALDEAHPDYPVPKFMIAKDCQLIVESMLEK